MAEQFGRKNYIFKRADLEVVSLSANVSLNVASGETYVEEIYAPVGAICEAQVIKITIPAPSGATSGTHSLYFAPIDGGTPVTKGTSNYNSDLYFAYGCWMTADYGQSPSDKVIQALMSKGLVFTDAASLSLVYTNDTDAVQTNVFQYRISAKKQVIA